jgi:hypothetical protein
MKRKFALLILVFLMLFGIYQLDQRRVHAQGRPPSPSPPPSTIPISYGHCVGYVHLQGSDGLIFEADDGTIRLMNLDKGVITVIPRSQ